MQQPLLQNLRWVRTFGDVVFIGGAIAMALQVVLVSGPGRPAATAWTAPGSGTGLRSGLRSICAAARQKFNSTEREQ